MMASSANNAGYTLSGYLQPYIKSTQIFKCPSDSVAVTTQPISYGYNYYYLARNGPSNATALAAIQTVSQTLMLVDGSGVDYVYPPEFWPLGTPTGYVIDRHLETVNTLWCDGHVKSVKMNSLRGPAGCTGVACDELWDLK